MKLVGPSHLRREARAKEKINDDDRRGSVDKRNQKGPWGWRDRTNMIGGSNPRPTNNSTWLETVGASLPIFSFVNFLALALVLSQFIPNICPSFASPFIPLQMQCLCFIFPTWCYNVNKICHMILVKSIWHNLGITYCIQ